MRTRAAGSVAGVPVLTTSDAVELHYEILGDDPRDARADLVVLLHGLSQQRHFWGPVTRGLPVDAGTCIITVDQRGHGDSDAPLESDFSIDRCAQDVVELVCAYEPHTLTLVGHSWGASVALRAGARLGSSCGAVMLIDGGVFGPAMLGDRDSVREMLRPPALGLPFDEILSMMRSGDLGDSWSSETEEALRPTFAIDEEGRARTRLGVDRHMKVLDGLLDYLPDDDLRALAAHHAADLWVVGCDMRSDAVDASTGWAAARTRSYERVSEIDPSARVIRLLGAVHDVPLQWPAVVSGLIQTAMTQARRDRRGA